MKIAKEQILLYSMIGLVAIVSATYFFVNQMVSADTATKSKTISIPTGFTAYDVETVNSISLDQIKSNNLTLFSYNDAKTNFKNWSVYGPDCSTFTNTDKAKCFDTIELVADTSYYLRNLKPEIKLLATSNKAKAVAPSILASGWHLASWSGQETRQSDFLKKLSLKDTSNQLQTLDYSIDKNLISTYIFEITKSNSKIVHKQLASIDSSTTTSSIKSNDSLWIYIFPNDKKFASFAKTDNVKTGKSIGFGLNLGPIEVGKIEKNKINLNQTIADIGANTMRYINFDFYVKTRKGDLQTSMNLKKLGMESMMGTWFPMSNIADDRNSTILSSKGTKYTTYAEVISDIKLYNTTSPEKLKKLLIEHYFKGIVIPRTTIYKDTIKYWQTWNEPNNKGETGIPAEVLALLTTGKVKTSSGIISFSNQTIEVSGKKYDLSKGASGLLKQICPDCTFAGGGFSGPAPDYFTILKSNDYMDFVDAEDIHTNLHPGYSMGYTRYWTTALDRSYDSLCGGSANCKKPFYSTEMASPSGAKYIDTVNNKPTGFTMTFSENFQADDLIKRFVTYAAKGFSKIDWNGFYDTHGAKYNGKTCPTSPDADGWYSFNTPNALCHHPMKGLFKIDSAGKYTKKLSYTAYQVATSMLGYAKKVEILKKGNDEHTDVDPVMLFRITDSDGKQKYSAWCEPFWNITTPEKKAWNYEDRKCSKQIDLSEYGVKGIVSVTDRAGKTKELKANSVTLTQSPIFIELN